MRTLPLLFGVLLLAVAAPARAQSGFALKGHYLYNGSAVSSSERIPAADGFSVGAEMVLPLGLGVGVSGYTAGSPGDFNARTSSFGLLGEANYFLPLPLLPVAPYVGVHAGLGRTSRESLESGSAPRLEDRTGTQFGYQAGVRFPLTRWFGVDAQWRRVSVSAAREQDSRLQRNQLLLGITLF